MNRPTFSVYLVLVPLLLASTANAFGVGIGTRGLQARHRSNGRPAAVALAGFRSAERLAAEAVQRDALNPSPNPNQASENANAANGVMDDLSFSYASNEPFQRASYFHNTAANSNSKSMPLSLTLTLTLLTAIFAISSPAHAAAAKTAAPSPEHLHIGQKIASYFRSFGLPDLAILAIISALPVVELRGAVPVGVWMGLPITTVLPVCVLGNMCPIVPLMFLLRNDKLKKLMSPILSRAEKKSASLGVGSIEKQWASLAAFVGIPLPGTGAWTGAMGAFLLGMPTAVALSSIFTGVVAAGCIMTAITLAGKRGGIAALAALAVITGREFFAKKEDGDNYEI